jgi:ABC-type sugar transport system substrate-binding protein
MKTFTKVIESVLVMGVCAGMMISCNKSAGGKTETGKGTGSAVASGNGKVVIGYNYFGSNSYALLSLANNSKEVIDAFGESPLAMDDEFSVEKIVQDIENMISHGVNGLIIWLPVETLYPTVSKMCQDAKVPFVLNDKIPTNPDIVATLKANPYFAGAIAPANSVYGEAIAKFALNKGYKTCIISSSSVGDPSDTPRLEAFKKAYAAGGGKVLAELHTDSADAAQSQIEDALIAHPNPDLIYGVGSDFGIAACNALKGKSFKTKVVTSGLDKAALELLQGDKMEMVNGDFWVCGMLSAVILQNYLDGTPLKDAQGNMIWFDQVMPFEVPKNQYSLYVKYFLNEYCYSPEELRQMSGKSNSSFNYDAFMNVIKNYSLENRLFEKYKEGKISKDEMKAAGISVD